MFLTSLKQTCSEYLIKFSENQSAPKLENRKTSPCSPCAPNLLHVLVSRIPGYHNLCSPGYQYEQCDYSCAHASRLKRHRLKHTGEKPFKCDQCNYSSNNSSNLKVHKRTHTGEEPYTCNQCSFSSKTSSDLQKHVTRKHKEQPNV